MPLAALDYALRHLCRTALKIPVIPDFEKYIIQKAQISAPFFIALAKEKDHRLIHNTNIIHKAVWQGNIHVVTARCH